MYLLRLLFIHYFPLSEYKHYVGQDLCMFCSMLYTRDLE